MNSYELKPSVFPPYAVCGMKRHTAKWLVWVAVISLSGCISSPNRPLQLISGAGPTYPAAAKAAGINGVVVVRYDVTRDGLVVNAVVESSEPAGVFDEAALTAVRSWRFNPQIVDHKPQPVVGIVSPIRFRVDGAEVYEDL